MNRLMQGVLLLLLSAVAPSLAAAGISLEETVFARATNTEGEAVGHVEDFLLDRDGNVVALLINTDLTAEQASEARIATPARRKNVYEELHEYAAEDMTFNAENREIVLRAGSGPASGNRSAYADIDDMPVGQVRATELLGLPVNLADDRGAGKVHDVMIDVDDTRVDGIVVEVASLFGNDLYLFPPDIAAYDRAQQELNFAVAGAELETLRKLPR